MTQPSLTIVRRIRASPQKLFDAFTRPELIALWWGPDAGPVLHAETDVRVGGRFRIVFKTLDGETHEMTGAYRAVEPARRLVWDTTWSTVPERQSVVTVDFAPTTDGTELTVHHAQLLDDEVRASHRDGWNGTLAKLQSLLETSPERIA